MKKLLASLIALAFIGCASVSTVPNPELTVEYYFTTSEKETTRVYPEKDYQWVLEEIKSDDNIEVSLIWDMEDSIILGMCFDHLDTEEEHDACGALGFMTVEDKFKFMNEFEGDGTNVFPLIVDAFPLSVENFMINLQNHLEGK